MKFKLKKSNSKPVQKTRKELRKEKRQQKKVNRAQYYLNKVANKNTDFNDSVEKNKVNNNDNNNIIVVNNKCKPVKKVKTSEELIKEKLKLQVKRQKRTEKKQLNYKNELLKEDQEKEDKMINKLEKKLKMIKVKGKGNERKKVTVIPQSFADDGLDYLLNFCDDKESSGDKKFDLTSGMMKNALLEFDSDDDDDDDDDYDDEPPTKKKKFNLKNSGPQEKEEEEEEDEGSEINSMSDQQDFSDEFDGSDDEPEAKADSVSEDDFFITEEQQKSKKTKSRNVDDKKFKINCESEEDNYNDEGSEDNINSDGIWEDIYGRKRDKDGNILIEEKSSSDSKYIPPAARLKQLEESTAHKEKLQRLRRQLKGLINRLAEQNLLSISNQIEMMYMSNSRHDMNELLTMIMTESLVSPVLTPDRLVAEHMLLVTILHANVGTEVGAHFLLSVVKKINKMLNESQKVQDKTLDNYIFMLSHLYNFKVFGSQLLYQILQKLADKFTEKEIECILLILKTVGFVLRKDDSLALKELIINLQQKASISKSTNSRIQFMLQVLMAIKNNNMNKIPQYDPSYVEHLKKKLKSFLRNGISVTQFNISLNDLLNANENGKWWIVGSAWSGNIDSASKSLKDKNLDDNLQFSEQILELARKQRMNTDVRRNIFCILITAEDCEQAFENIQRLALKDQPAREIMNVIVHCCLQEKKFNRFYAFIAQKYCDYDRKYQITLQCLLWDKFKELQDFSKEKLINLAQFLAHLFIGKGLALSVLKTISFVDLNPKTMILVRKIMIKMLLHDDVEACIHAFKRISLSPQLQNLRDQLRLFLHTFLPEYIKKGKLSEESVQKLEKRIILVEKIFIH